MLWQQITNPLGSESELRFESNLFTTVRLSQKHFTVRSAAISPPMLYRSHTDNVLIIKVAPFWDK